MLAGQAHNAFSHNHTMGSQVQGPPVGRSMEVGTQKERPRPVYCGGTGEGKVPRRAWTQGIWFACIEVAPWLSPLYSADHKCCLAVPCSLIVTLTFD